MTFCKVKKPIARGNLQPVHHKTANLKGYDLKMGAIISLLHAEYFLCDKLIATMGVLIMNSDSNLSRDTLCYEKGHLGNH